MAYIKEYWDDKETRRKQAIAHTEEMNRRFETDIDISIDKTVSYHTDFKCKSKSIYPTIGICVVPVDSVSAIFNYSQGKTAVLNFSSYKNAGGMFMKGSKAQEESLCHESFLYNVLSKFEDTFYKWNCEHKNKALYLNRALYSPDIFFIRMGEIKECDVITCAAPNISAASKYMGVSKKENYSVVDSRIKYILDIAASNHVDTLILGAYGCGVFGQDATEIASIFKRYLLTEYKCFKRVIFAIPQGRNKNYETFKTVFERKE